MDQWVPEHGLYLQTLHLEKIPVQLTILGQCSLHNSLNIVVDLIKCVYCNVLMQLVLVDTPSDVCTESYFIPFFIAYNLHAPSITKKG